MKRMRLGSMKSLMNLLAIRGDRTTRRRRRIRVGKGMIHKDGAVGYGCGNRGVAVKGVPVRLISSSQPFF